MADNHDRGVPAIFMLSHQVIRETTMEMSKVREIEMRVDKNVRGKERA